MTRKALCVGINDYPGVDNDLNGCVNDAMAWADLLVEHYGFVSRDVTMLLNAKATKASVVAALKALLVKAKPGDVLVFTNSSHGTYVADDSGDEAYDEAICPYDVDRNLLLDDELRELFGGIPAGTGLYVISDSCHSGTLTRAAVGAAHGGPNDDDRRVRFLNPAAIGRRVLNDADAARPRRGSKYPQGSMKEVLFSGCSPAEYSYDARIGGKYHGAMSAMALRAIREANYAITWQELHARSRSLLDAAEFAQHPQLEGTSANKKKRLFS